MTVGIPGWMVGQNSFGITIGYMEFIRESLGCDDLRILAPDSPIFIDINLLILPGGADINPARYGEFPGFYTEKPDLLKEYFDIHVLPKYIEQKTRIFSICRGTQSIAVHFGCTLIQNMWHETNKSEDPYCGVHYLNVFAEPNKKIKVNSRHHQSIRYPDASSPVKVIATHKDKKHHVEAIKIEGYPIVGVQYHPEDLSEYSGIEYTMSLIKNLLK